MSADDPNELIVVIAQRRDRAAFRKLFLHFAPRLKSFLVRQGAAPMAAEELAQETLVMVWRKADLFDPAKASAGTWIFRIARNLRLDSLRREHSGASRPEIEGGDAPPTPEALQIAHERDELVQRALATLSKDQIDVLRLSFFQDKPHAQIARELSIPLGTVKSRVRIALRRLRSILDAHS